MSEIQSLKLKFIAKYKSNNNQKAGLMLEIYHVRRTYIKLSMMMTIAFSEMLFF